MQNLINDDNKQPWVRPWNMEKFDDLYNRDDRFLAIIIKGALSWLTRNIVLYNKSIKHFIINTGSSYLYVESNGYEFSWNETSGEDMMYMSLPRCIVNIGDISIPFDELTSPFSRGVYERREGNDIVGFNSEIRRLPIEISLSLTYVLSNTNESLILAQELLDTIVFQQYYNVIYLGQTIECSLEFPQGFHIEFNKIDLAGTEVNQKTMGIELKLCSNYPIINSKAEQHNDKLIGNFTHNVKPFLSEIDTETNKSDNTQKIIN